MLLLFFHLFTLTGLTLASFMKTATITFLSALFGILCLPYLLVIAVASWLHSWFLSWRLKPLGLERMSGIEAFMAHYSNQVITFQFFLTGLPTIDLVKQKTVETLVQAKDDSGNLRFLKFSLLMEKCYGLWFWSKAATVYPDNHIKMYKGNAPTSEGELKRVIADINSEPLASDIPQWLIILVPLQGEFLACGLQSCILIRLHHCLADAYSVMKLIATHFGDEQVELEPKNLLGNIQESRIHKSFMILYAMCSVFRVWLVGRKSARNLLHGKPLHQKNLVTWAVFDLQTVKSIKNATKTSLTDVLLSCLAGAIRRYFVFKNSPYPSAITCMVPMGKYKPNSDFQLQNDIIVSKTDIVIGVKDPLKRLAATSRSFQDFKSSPDVVVSELAIQFVLPYFTRFLLDWLITYMNSVTIGISSLAGPPNGNFHMFGHKVPFALYYQPHVEDIGLTISFFGQKDKLFVAFNTDTAIINCQEDLETIITFVKEELDVLCKNLLPDTTPNLHIPLCKIHC